MVSGAMAKKKAAKAEGDENLIYIFTYLFTWLSGIIIFITVGQKNKRLKFHAIQAVLLGIVAFVLAYIPLPFFSLIGVLVWLYGLYLGYRGYQGRDISAPVIGEYATRYSS